MASTHTTHAPRSRRAFALAVVLVAVLLTVVALSRSAAHAISLRTSADVQLSRLQIEWGRRSIEDSVTNTVLIGAAHNQSAVFSSQGTTVTLAGRQFQVRAFDEQAKANINTLLRRGPASAVEASLRSVVSPTRNLVLQLPNVDRRPKNIPLQPCESYSDMLKNVDAAIIWPQGNDSPSEFVQLLTCWSDGRLYLKGATPKAVRLACGDVISKLDADRLLRLAQQRPKATTGELIDALSLPENKTKALRSCLTDKSECISVWTRVTADPNSTWSMGVSWRTPKPAQENAQPQADTHTRVSSESSSRPNHTVRFRW